MHAHSRFLTHPLVAQEATRMSLTRRFAAATAILRSLSRAHAVAIQHHHRADRDSDHRRHGIAAPLVDGQGHLHVARRRQQLQHRARRRRGGNVRRRRQRHAPASRRRHVQRREPQAEHAYRYRVITVVGTSLDAVERSAVTTLPLGNATRTSRRTSRRAARSTPTRCTRSRASFTSRTARR